MTVDAEFVSELRRDVLAYAQRRSGKIYAPIEHPAFSDIPAEHGPERFDIISKHVPPTAKTALDIGSHWGYFATRLEGLGLRVTAVENSKDYLPFLRRIKQLCGSQFEIYDRSIFDLDKYDYDLVIALNIFHHFTKKQRVFEQFSEMLAALNCEAMFFQAHNPQEGQMEGAYRNFAPDEFAQFVAEQAGLPRIEKLATFGRRPLFLLTK